MPAAGALPGGGGRGGGATGVGAIGPGGTTGGGCGSARSSGRVRVCLPAVRVPVGVPGFGSGAVLLAGTDCFVAAEAPAAVRGRVVGPAAVRGRAAAGSAVCSAGRDAVVPPWVDVEATATTMGTPSVRARMSTEAVASQWARGRGRVGRTSKVCATLSFGSAIQIFRTVLLRQRLPGGARSHGRAPPRPLDIGNPATCPAQVRGFAAPPHSGCAPSVGWVGRSLRRRAVDVCSLFLPAPAAGWCRER